MKTKLFLFFAAAVFGLTLAACTALPATPTAGALPPASSPAPAATATQPPAPSATAMPSTATPWPPTATQVSPTSTPAPTNTLPPTAAPTLVLLFAPAGDSSETLDHNIQLVVKNYNWQTDWKQAATLPDLRAAAQAGANVLVVADRTLEADTLTVAKEFPQSYFICVHLSDAGGLPNVLALGGAARDDQAGFMAGVAAGYVTQAKRVAVIGDPQSVTGRNYRNGFLHGVRYACPKCQVDTLDVLNLGDTANVVDLAAKYELYGVDVFFAAAGEAGDAALVKVAQAGAWVIGSGSDLYVTRFASGTAAGADRVLTSVYLNPTLAVVNALRGYGEGAPEAGVQSLSATNLAIILAPVRDKTGALSPLDQQEMAGILMRLGLGTLETGIDPATGEER